MRYLVTGALLILGGWGICDEPPAETATEEKKMSIWMEKKLDYSQAILRGLAMRDFESIKFHADKMNLLSKVEGFVRRKNQDYRTQLNTFKRVSSEIARQAEKENIEGATLAFNMLTVSCVDCHKTLRSPKRLAGSKTLQEVKPLASPQTVTAKTDAGKNQ